MDSIIEKIRKLRGLSKSSNVHEAAAAAAKANSLIDQHRLTEADLEDKNNHEDVAEEEEPLYESGRIQNWKHRLACVLAENYGCAVYILKSRRNKRYKVVGRKSDTDIVRYMFAWLTAEVARLCTEEMKGEGHVACFSYCEGAVTGIASQIYRSRQETVKTAQASGLSSALVKLDERKEEVKNYLSTLHLRKTKQESKGQLDSNAFERGKQKGENLHLGKVMNTTGSNRQLTGK